jgi:hypothetical protein
MRRQVDRGTRRLGDMEIREKAYILLGALLPYPLGRIHWAEALSSK